MLQPPRRPLFAPVQLRERPGAVPREAREEHVRRVVDAEPVVGSVPVDGILDAAVDPLVALAALRAVVLQPGVRVADAMLEPLRELLLEDDRDRVVLAAAEGQTAPFDALVLRILPERLGHGSIEPG